MFIRQIFGFRIICILYAILGFYKIAVSFLNFCRDNLRCYRATAYVAAEFKIVGKFFGFRLQALFL